jgi:hypothetical protein
MSAVSQRLQTRTGTRLLLAQSAYSPQHGTHAEDPQPLHTPACSFHPLPVLLNDLVRQLVDSRATLPLAPSLQSFSHRTSAPSILDSTHYICHARMVARREDRLCRSCPRRTWLPDNLYRGTQIRRSDQRAAPQHPVFAHARRGR